MSLTVEDLHFSYPGNPVLMGVSFQAEKGEFLSILGPNGTGKSTLLRCILGLLTPLKGTARIDGQNIAGMTAAELARRIAYIPQSHSPVFNYSVMDMVLMGTASQVGSFSSPGKKQREAALAALKKFGIEGLAGSGYQNISGGQRQLVLIARAIAQDAELLIMDEPSSSLDFGNKIRLMQAVRELAAEGYTIIQSTHDPESAFLYSDKILALSEGRVLSFGSPKEIIRDEVISALYGVEISVCSLKEDRVRVCIPREI